MSAGWRNVLSLTIAVSFYTGAETVEALTNDPFVSAYDILSRYESILGVMEAENDDRQVFMAMILVTTQQAARAIDEGFFEDPEWIEAFLLDFNNRYRAALWNSETGHDERVPEAWRVAFDAAKDPDVSVFTQAILGIHAHVNYDLAFSVAAVVPREDRAWRFQQFVSTNEFLLSAVDAVEDAVSRYDPFLALLDELLGRFDEWILDLTLTEWRFNAWRAAANLDPEDTPWRRLLHAGLLEWRAGLQARVLRGHWHAGVSLSR